MYELLRRRVEDMRIISSYFRELADEAASESLRGRILAGAARLDGLADSLGVFEGELDVAWSEDSETGGAADVRPTRATARAR